MRVSAYLIFTILILCSIFASNSIIADNVTGLYKQNCLGSHYYAYVPEDCAKKTDIPLVVALHSNSSNAKKFISWWTDEADKYKFAVLAVQCEGEYWSKRSEPVIMDSMSTFQEECNFNKKRILFTGFGGGADMAIAINLDIKRCQAVGVVGGGEIDDDWDKKKLSKSKDLPIFYYSGLDDYNLEDIKKSVKRLKDAGYKNVTLETVDDEDDEEDTLCYHDDASEKIWLWFDKIGVVHRIEEIIPKAEKAYEEKNLVEAFYYYYSIKLFCQCMDSCEYKENKSKVDKIVDDTKEKLKKLEGIWEKKYPEEYKQLEKCLKYFEKNKNFDGAKKLMKVIEEFPDSDAEKFSKLILDRVLSEDIDTADKIAGSKVKSEFQDAKKTLLKKDREQDEKDEAIEVLKKILIDYPFTSYAKEAKDLIRKYEFS